MNRKKIIYNKFNIYFNQFQKIFKNLNTKYNSFKYSYNNYCINNLILSNNTHIVCCFKDNLLYNDLGEYLKRFYKKNEITSRLLIICKYYKESSNIFPNYICLPESNYLYNNIKRKQHFKNSVNKKKLINLYTKKNSIENNKINNELFTKKIIQEIQNFPLNDKFKNNKNDKKEILIQNSFSFYSKINDLNLEDNSINMKNLENNNDSFYLNSEITETNKSIESLLKKFNESKIFSNELKNEIIYEKYNELKNKNDNKKNSKIIKKLYKTSKNMFSPINIKNNFNNKILKKQSSQSNSISKQFASTNSSLNTNKYSKNNTNSLINCQINYNNNNKNKEINNINNSILNKRKNILNTKNNSKNEYLFYDTKIPTATPNLKKKNIIISSQKNSNKILRKKLFSPQFEKKNINYNYNKYKNSNFNSDIKISIDYLNYNAFKLQNQDYFSDKICINSARIKKNIDFFDSNRKNNNNSIIKNKSNLNRNKISTFNDYNTNSNLYYNKINMLYKKLFPIMNNKHKFNRNSSIKFISSKILNNNNNFKKDKLFYNECLTEKKKNIITSIKNKNNHNKKYNKNNNNNKISQTTCNSKEKNINFKKKNFKNFILYNKEIINKNKCLNKRNSCEKFNDKKPNINKLNNFNNSKIFIFNSQNTSSKSSPRNLLLNINNNFIQKSENNNINISYNKNLNPMNAIKVNRKKY